MTAVWVPVLVALIGGPVMWFLSRLDKRNTEQHGRSMEVLERVESKMDRVDGKVDRLDAKVDRLDTRVTFLETPTTQKSSRPRAKSV